MRLVLPPALGAILSFPIWGFCHLIAPQGMGEAFISGAYLGLIMYDMVHYFSHHGKPWGSYLKSVKSYHLDHHYKNVHLGYGVSSKYWDLVFHTQLY
jgi:4-hydroxysphinganine ceramide fatty acyl 2-hydroxylase